MNKVLTLISLLFISLSMAAQDVSVERGRFRKGDDPAWKAYDYDDSAWTVVNQYKNDWAKSDGRGIVGSIWLRQHVHIDKAHAGQPARLPLPGPSPAAERR